MFIDIWYKNDFFYCQKMVFIGASYGAIGHGVDGKIELSSMILWSWESHLMSLTKRIIPTKRLCDSYGEELHSIIHTFYKKYAIIHTLVFTNFDQICWEKNINTYN